MRAVGGTWRGSTGGAASFEATLYSDASFSGGPAYAGISHSLFNVISMPDIELREVEFDIEGPIVAVTESEAVDRHLSQTRAN